MDHIYKIKFDLAEKLAKTYGKYKKVINAYNMALMKPHYMAFDIETTGLPEFCKQGYHNPIDIKKYDSSRVVQVAYIMFTKKGDIVKSKKIIIKPEGFLIQQSKFHNITHDIGQSKGKPMSVFLDMLEKDIVDVEEIIGHNVIFDIKIMSSEMYRVGYNELVDVFSNLKINCTMDMSKKLCGLMTNTIYGPRLKSPSLVEASKIIIGQDLENPHDAYNDAMCSARIFFIINKYLASQKKF